MSEQEKNWQIGHSDFSKYQQLRPQTAAEIQAQYQGMMQNAAAQSLVPSVSMQNQVQQTWNTGGNEMLNMMRNSVIGKNRFKIAGEPVIDDLDF